MELSTQDAWKQYLKKRIFHDIPWSFNGHEHTRINIYFYKGYVGFIAKGSCLDVIWRWPSLWTRRENWLRFIKCILRYERGISGTWTMKWTMPWENISWVWILCRYCFWMLNKNVWCSFVYISHLWLCHLKKKKKLYLYACNSCIIWMNNQVERSLVSTTYNLFIFYKRAH